MVLKGLEVKGKKIAPPPKVLVNKDNISIPQKAQLNSIRLGDDEENPYNIMGIRV